MEGTVATVPRVLMDITVRLKSTLVMTPPARMEANVNRVTQEGTLVIALMAGLEAIVRLK